MNDSLKIETRGERELVITRTFDAPRKLVFEAMGSPRLLPRWLTGPPGWTMTTCEIDERAGGTFKHVWRGPDGTEMGMSGVYREVVRPERVVRTEVFDFGCEAQAGEQLCTMVLTETNGRTRMQLTVRYPSREARDGALRSGMEHGMSASYANLDEVLRVPA